MKNRRMEALENEIEELKKDRDYWRDLFIKHEHEYDAARSHAQLEDFKIKVDKMELKPGDVVAFKAPGQISDALARQLKDYTEKWLPGIKVFVLGDGLELAKHGP